jgi:hypothetical protein
MERSQSLTWKRTEDTQEESGSEKPRVALHQALHDRGEAEEHHVSGEPRMRREFLHPSQYKQVVGILASISPSSRHLLGFRIRPNRVSTLGCGLADFYIRRRETHTYCKLVSILPTRPQLFSKDLLVRRKSQARCYIGVSQARDPSKVRRRLHSIC